MDGQLPSISLIFAHIVATRPESWATEISRILPSLLLLKEVVLFPDPKLSPSLIKKKVHNAHFPCCRCLPSWAALSSKMDIIFSQKNKSLLSLSHFSKLINKWVRERMSWNDMSPWLTIGCSCTIVIIHDKFSHPLNLSWSSLLTPHKTWLFLIRVESQQFTPPAGYIPRRVAL